MAQIKQGAASLTVTTESLRRRYLYEMTAIEPLHHNGKALPNMDDINLLSHNDPLWRYQIIIFVKVVNDATPCHPPKH